jgi:hypothetical protein
MDSCPVSKAVDAMLQGGSIVELLSNSDVLRTLYVEDKDMVATIAVFDDDSCIAVHKDLNTYHETAFAADCLDNAVLAALHIESIDEVFH